MTGVVLNDAVTILIIVIGVFATSMVFISLVDELLAGYYRKRFARESETPTAPGVKVELAWDYDNMFDTEETSVKIESELMGDHESELSVTSVA